MNRVIDSMTFHVHHNQLFEWCYDYRLRRNVIRQDKDKTEQPLRLKLIQIVPSKKLPRSLRPLEAHTRKAMWIWTNFLNNNVSWGEAEIAYKAAAAEWKTPEAQTAVETLHRKLCKNCPWNGKTIFTRKNKKGIWY